MRKIFTIAFIVLSSFIISRAQFETSTVSIDKQEFFNPAFNSYKEDVSINVINREQWAGDVGGSPSLLGVNFYIPMRTKNIGFGGNLIAEDIGLRKLQTLQFSATSGVSLGVNSYLAIGIGVGIRNIAYQFSKMRYYSDVDISEISREQVNPVASLGVMFLTGDYFLGASSIVLKNKNELDFKYLNGFDMCVGRIYVLNQDFVFKTTLVGKYYKQTRYNVFKKAISEQFVPPVLDWSLYCLLYDRVWLGSGIRFNQAASIVVKTKITEQLSLGFKYEKGTGSGLNRYDSRLFQLSYNFGSKSRFNLSHNKRGLLSRTARRYNPLSKYLY